MGFGQFFGNDWIQIQVEPDSSQKYAKQEYSKILARVPEHAQSMDKAPSEAQVHIMQMHLHQLTLRTCVVWRSPRENGVKLEVFQHPSLGHASGEWMGFNVDVSGIFPVSTHHSHISIDITVHRQ